MPSTRAKAKTKPTPAPWWMRSGEEECPHCGQFYAYEVEFRCPDCDGPSCPHCVVRHAERRVCVNCCDESANEE